MSNSTILLIVALIILVVLVIYTVVGNRKARKYKITVADTVYEVTRYRWDALDDEKDLKCYHKDNGKRVWFSNHFTIMKEEL
jgi:uncharacterized membrane protein